MSTSRKATDAELRTIAQDGSMAPNSVFDGVEYRVVPQSSGDSAPAKKSAPARKTTAKKATTAKSEAAAEQAEQNPASGVPATDTTGGDTEVRTDNAHAARGPQ